MIAEIAKMILIVFGAIIATVFVLVVVNIIRGVIEWKELERYMEEIRQFAAGEGAEDVDSDDQTEV